MKPQSSFSSMGARVPISVSMLGSVERRPPASMTTSASRSSPASVRTPRGYRFVLLVGVAVSTRDLGGRVAQRIHAERAGVFERLHHLGEILVHDPAKP